MAKVETGSWRQLAEQKEKEWREILESRIKALEEEKSEKEKELFEEKAKFHELKEHFKYNLKLLEDRDRELEKYDISFQELRASSSSKNAEISELKIRIDDLKNVINREEQAKDELQSNYQRRLKEKQAEVDAYKSSKDNEVQGEREEYEKFRRNLHKQLASVQNELETQKRELSSEFESALKKREHEFKIQKDELEAKVFECDLKAKLLEKELELTRDSNQKTLNHAEEIETTHRDLEKVLKQKEWELADITAIKDSQIAELQNQLSVSESTIKKVHEDFQRKYTEMDRTVREREDILERTKTGYLEKEQALQAANQELHSKLEDAQIKERQMVWSHEDMVKEKDLKIEKLLEEVQDMKERWDRHVAEISRSTVERDMELGTAQEEQQRLRQELEQRKQDLDRYKRELKAAADREEQLDRAKLQAELDWQRRCESLETRQYNVSEDLIEKLTSAKNEAQALVREQERDLHHKTLLIKSLHGERDQLRSLLKEHHIPLENFVKYSIDTDLAEEEMTYVESLLKQNSDLKQLIAQMRSDMESLAPGDLKSDEKDPAEKEKYERKLQDLKQQNKDLQERLKDKKVLSGTMLTIDSSKEREVMAEVEGNSAVKNHILALNGTIGSLRSEKIELAAAVKKQQVRIAYLENCLEDISKQPRQKQIQIDQLTYELSSSKQRAETEISGLQRRVGDLELQLGEARREADEYHRASLESNQELVALGNQLAALKMDQGNSNAAINFGAQELYIQQLQTELSQLRKRASALQPTTVLSASSSGSDSAQPATEDRSDMQYKLRSAAVKIVQLARENQQLTESNNKLRTELKAALKTNPQGNSGHALRNKFSDQRGNMNFESDQDKDSLKEREILHNRLSKLENLQYQLTRQELQFAHRFKDTSKEEKALSESDSIPEKDISGVMKKVTSPRGQGISTFHENQGQSPSIHASQKQRMTQGAREGLDTHFLMSLSSGGGESIQQVWQMLDESMTSGGPSERIVQSPRSAKACSKLLTNTELWCDRGEENKLLLKGQKAKDKGTSEHQRQRPSAREAAINYAQKVRRPIQQAKPKIRNYNVRDDASGSR
ncbi:coiled-coil domain-containing protein 57-like [Plakobranchus ocellatus]|uniref:Coiled-coil domain-containing protein 57-like n=1 Tax=Plakobranchus ocellatus TaxID=259542 RepID=A0AAV3YWE7_9GAST|nr:coiled-coil domain-containing protein 57-like [Plakobranchus ocellatus]